MELYLNGYYDRYIKNWDGGCHIHSRNRFPDNLKNKIRNVYLDVSKFSFCKCEGGTIHEAKKNQPKLYHVAGSLESITPPNNFLS